MKFFITTFIIYMGGAVVLSMFNPYGLYEVSTKTYFIFTAAVTSFGLGLKIFNTNINKNDNGEFYVSDFIDNVIKKRLFIIFLIAFDIFVIYLYLRQAVLLNVYSALEMRADLDELLYQGNSFLGLGKNMVIDPLGTVITFLGAYMLLYRRNFVLPLSLCLIYIFCDAMLGGSRGGFFKIFLYCVFMLSIRDLIRPLNVKNKSSNGYIILVIVAAVVFVIMCNMTAQRTYSVSGFSKENVLLGLDDMSKQFITYTVGPFRLLDYAFANDYFSKFGGLQFGRCTFGFIDGTLSLVLRQIGISYTATNQEVVSVLQGNWIDVGENTMNFAYTAFYFFYQDLGIIGIVFFPLLFAYVIKMSIRKFQDNRSPFMLVLISYFFYASLYMVFSWALYRNVSFMILFYILLFNQIYKKKYINGKSIISSQ